jgi:phosphotriesterase-related protein
LSEEELAAGLARDARAKRWGAFGELGSSAEWTPLQKKAFRVTGKAHLLTNLPILTHTPEGKDFRPGSRMGIEQLDILESVGVKPQHIAIGHLDFDESLTESRMTVAKRGAFVGLDHAGVPEKDAGLVKMALALIEAGHADKVLLSSDFASEKNLKKNGGPGYAMTIIKIVPLLKKAGVSEATIHQITTDNPRRFLAFVPKNA